MGERRKARRSYRGLLAYFWYDGVENKALTVDISASGAFLSTNTILPVGAVTYVRLDENAVPTGRAIYFMARTVRQVYPNPIVSMVPGFGIEWILARSHAGRDQLERFLREFIFDDSAAPAKELFVHSPLGTVSYLFDPPMPNEIPLIADAFAQTGALEDPASPRRTTPPKPVKGYERRYPINKQVSFQDGDVLHSAVVRELSATSMLIFCDPPVPKARAPVTFPYPMTYKGKPFQVIISGTVESRNEDDGTFELLISSVDDRGEPALFNRYVQFLEHTRQKHLQAEVSALKESLPKTTTD